MVYFATESYVNSVHNDPQKLAVVSDLPRSLVLAHSSMCGLFFAWRNNMLYFFRKLFCFHAYEFDYDHEHGYTQECRKCGKDD